MKDEEQWMWKHITFNSVLKWILISNFKVFWSWFVIPDKYEFKNKKVILKSGSKEWEIARQDIACKYEAIYIKFQEALICNFRENFQAWLLLCKNKKVIQVSCVFDLQGSWWEKLKWKWECHMVKHAQM